MYPISGKKKRRTRKEEIMYPNSFFFFFLFFFEKVQIPKFTAKGDNVSKILSKNQIDGASPKKEKNNLLKKRKKNTIFEMEVKGFNEFDSGIQPNWV